MSFVSSQVRYIYKLYCALILLNSKLYISL